MSENRIQELLAQSVNPSTVKIVGSYTHPRTYGVYEIPTSSSIANRFRFGNHPVREIELARECGDVAVIAILPDRDQAKELASLFNNITI